MGYFVCDEIWGLLFVVRYVDLLFVVRYGGLLFAMIYVGILFVMIYGGLFFVMRYVSLLFERKSYCLQQEPPVCNGNKGLTVCSRNRSHCL